jgi:hypothetical protein
MIGGELWFRSIVINETAKAYGLFSCAALRAQASLTVYATELNPAAGTPLQHGTATPEKAVGIMPAAVPV